jgi:hypothetical protein
MPRWVEIFAPFIAIAAILAAILRKPWPMYVVAGAVVATFAFAIIAGLLGASFVNLRNRYRKKRDPQGFEQARREKDIGEAVKMATLNLKLLAAGRREDAVAAAVAYVLAVSDDPKYRDPAFWRRQVLSESDNDPGDAKLQRILEIAAKTKR